MNDVSAFSTAAKITPSKSNIKIIQSTVNIEPAMMSSIPTMAITSVFFGPANTSPVMGD